METEDAPKAFCCACFSAGTRAAGPTRQASPPQTAAAQDSKTNAAHGPPPGLLHLAQLQPAEQHSYLPAICDAVPTSTMPEGRERGPTSSAKSPLAGRAMGGEAQRDLARQSRGHLQLRRRQASDEPQLNELVVDDQTFAALSARAGFKDFSCPPPPSKIESTTLLRESGSFLGTPSSLLHPHGPRPDTGQEEALQHAQHVGTHQRDVGLASSGRRDVTALALAPGRGNGAAGPRPGENTLNRTLPMPPADQSIPRRPTVPKLAQVARPVSVPKLALGQVPGLSIPSNPVPPTSGGGDSATNNEDWAKIVRLHRDGAQGARETPTRTSHATTHVQAADPTDPDQPSSPRDMMQITGAVAYWEDTVYMSNGGATAGGGGASLRLGAEGGSDSAWSTPRSSRSESTW